MSVAPAGAASGAATSSTRTSLAGTVAWAGVVAGVLDIAYVIVFYGIKGVPAMRILQGVAAGLLGRDAAMSGGWGTAMLGLAIHFAIALVVAAVFVALGRVVRWWVAYPLVSGPIHGVLVWLAMNLVILPLTATPPKSFPPANWMPVFIAHLLCVGLPIAFVVRWREKGTCFGDYGR
jgi:uncharacterized membrane protein YagU involved in acid resistance